MDTKIIKIPNENLDDYLNNFISQSTKINIAVSFFFNSGLNLIIESLKKFKNKKNINIIASNYLNSTEPNALRTLLDLKNQGANVYIYDSENSKTSLPDPSAAEHPLRRSCAATNRFAIASAAARPSAPCEARWQT